MNNNNNNNNEKKKNDRDVVSVSLSTHAPIATNKKETLIGWKRRKIECNIEELLISLSGNQLIIINKESGRRQTSAKLKGSRINSLLRLATVTSSRPMRGGVAGFDSLIDW